MIKVDTLEILEKERDELEKDIEASKRKLDCMSIPMGKIYQTWIDKHINELEAVKSKIKELKKIKE